MFTKKNNQHNGIDIEGKIADSYLEYSTISAYVDSEGLDFSSSQKNIAGRIASDLSREQGVEIKQDSNHISGKVNSYRIDILKKTFEIIAPNNKAIRAVNTSTNHVRLGINHAKLVEKLDVNLVDKGLNSGTHHKGSISGLESSLRIIYTDYLADVNKLDTEQRDSIVSQIHNAEEEAIQSNNELRHLQENLIPDKQKEIDEIDTQLKDIGVTGLDSFIDLSNSGNSEMFPIWTMQKMNYKKVLNDFKAKTISLENRSQQINKLIEALNNQLGNFTYFSKDLLKNRLETFYNGWLKSYSFYEISEEQKEENANSFEMLRDDILAKK